MDTLPDGTGGEAERIESSEEASPDIAEVTSGRPFEAGNAGKLSLSYGTSAKLKLAYEADEALETGNAGKLLLSYGASGKLKLAYGEASEMGSLSKLRLSYDASGKLKLGYEEAQEAGQESFVDSTRVAKVAEVSSQASEVRSLSKLQLSYAASGKLKLGYEEAQEAGCKHLADSTRLAEAAEVSPQAAAAAAQDLEVVNSKPTEATGQEAADDDWEMVESEFQAAPEPVCAVPPAEPFEWTVDSGELPPTPTLPSALPPTQAEEDSEADGLDAASSPSKPQLPDVGVRTNTPSAEGGASSFKVGMLLAPPPPPPNSVGSPTVSKSGAVVIDQLVDPFELAPQPVASSNTGADPIDEKKLAAVAAALNVGPLARIQLGQEGKLKAFDAQETPDRGASGQEDEIAGINLAGAVDADIDDEACETLLGGDDRGSAPANRPMALGAMAPLRTLGRDDGLDSASEDEETPSKNRRSLGTAATQKPEACKTPESSLKPETPSPKAGPSAPPVKSMEEVDAQLDRNLDRFFEDDHLWQTVVAEMGKCPKLFQSLEWLQTIVAQVRVQFKVMVPEPYPGIQYRRSKVLTDRYTRYAKHGTIVAGHLEDDGEWLKVADNVFLPMRVGAVEILKAMQAPTEISSPFGAGRVERGRGGPAGWCGNCETSSSPVSSNLLNGVGARDAGEIGEVLVPDEVANACDDAAGRDLAMLRNQLDADGRLQGGRSHASQDHHPSGPLSHLDEASRLLSGSEPINPFTDTPRGGSPNTSPLKSRLMSDPMVPINPFSDTPPGGNSPRASPKRVRPAMSIP